MSNFLRILLIAGCVLSQLMASWDNVQGITAGEKIRVETAHAGQSGVFVEATSDSVTVRLEGGGETSVARAEVRRVYVATRSRRLRNTLIGAGIGVAVGVVFYATYGQIFRNEGAESGGFLATPIVIGTAVGALLPAGGMKKIYDAKKKQD